MPGSWALVGRDAELGRVAAAVRRPDRAGVVIVGPAGVGKSRLLAECLERGRQRGFAVVRARGSSVATAIPFGALATLLPPDATRGGGAEALAGARRVLRETAGDRPLLLAIDDAHLLDDASALLVHQLAVDLTAFVALTARTGEPVPDPITALWRDDLAERIEVDALRREHVEELLVGVLGGPVDPATEALIWQRSAGNALYLHELVVGALEAGTFASTDGVWSLRADAIPARLVDVVQERLRHLDDDGRTALSLIAFGEPLGVLLLERVVAPSALERLEQLGLIEVLQDGRRLDVRLAHPLHGEIVRQATPLLEARSRRRALADLLDAVGARRREDGFRLAVWRLEGGGEMDVDRLVEAARSARHAGDLELGERLARAAIERDGGFAAPLELGLCLYKSGDPAAARAVLEPLAPKADADRAALATALADVDFWGLGSRADAVAVLEEARRAIGPDAPEAADLVAMEAMVEAHSGRAERAAELAAGPAEGPPSAAAFEASIAATIALSGAGRCVGALAVVDGLSAWPDLPLDARIATLHVRTTTLVGLGRLEEAETCAVESHRLAVELGDLIARGYSAAVLGWVLLSRGRLTPARRSAHEASSLFRATKQAVARRWALSLELLALALADARAEATGIAAALDSMEAHDGHLHEPLEQMGRAWLASAAGELDTARAVLAAGVDACEATGKHGLALLALHDLARLGAPDPARAAALAGRGDSAYLEAVADHIAALERADATGLAAAAEAFAEFGADLLAAEAAASARDAFARRGDQVAAGTWGRRSRELADRCEGASTPGLGVPQVAVPLTRREREVATLVAGGRTSRAVADQLHLSVRTVDNHLGRVYDKLGVSNRVQLAEALGR